MILADLVDIVSLLFDKIFSYFQIPIILCGITFTFYDILGVFLIFICAFIIVRKVIS